MAVSPISTPRPQPPKPEPHNGSRKNLLVRAAAELFHRAGVQAVSVDDIIQASGVSRPTLYRHFQSKEELLLACVEWQTAQKFESLDAAMAAANAQPAAQVLAALRFMAGNAAELQGGFLALDVAREFSNEAHPVRQAACRATQQIQERLAEPLRTTLGSRAEQIAAHLTLLILGTWTSARLNGRQIASELLSASAERLLVDAGPANKPRRSQRTVPHHIAASSDFAAGGRLTRRRCH